MLGVRQPDESRTAYDQACQLLEADNVEQDCAFTHRRMAVRDLPREGPGLEQGSVHVRTWNEESCLGARQEWNGALDAMDARLPQDSKRYAQGRRVDSRNR